jgi:hypothetical protein
MKYPRLKTMQKSVFRMTLLALGVAGIVGKVYAVGGIVSSGLDTTGGIVANADSDADGVGIFSVVVGSDYTGYGDPGTAPGLQAQFQVNVNSVQMNRNTNITNGGTLGVTGATTLSSTLLVNGATTLDGATTINNSLVTDNGAIAANLRVNSSTNQASLTVRAAALGSTDSGIFINGVDTGVAKPNVQVKGGTRSGILTLQDGDAPSNLATPAGTSITISGSGGGTAATVFQTTTNANTTSVTTAVGTNASYAGGSTATLQAGSTNAVTVNSGNAGVTPGVSINGVVGTGSTSTTGVLITGSGQNSQPYTTADRTNGVTPTWADVAIQSKSYGLGNPTLGAAILITDYGVQMISPQPIAGQQIINNTGINNSTGSIVNNNGMNTSSGSVINNTGGNSGSGSATNNFGMNGSTSGGTVANNIGGTSGNGNVTNTIGQNNGTGIATNGFGTGSGVTNNFIGNNNSGSTVQLDGGSSRMTLNGNGATFSNPTTGGPIQVHGVADGSSPHDAVNVRQLFSGIAASMATAPTVTNMKPGDAGVGVGFGQYGGYSAMGINLTYYARNEAQLNLGIARSMQSGAQTAVRASVGFKF